VKKIQIQIQAMGMTEQTRNPPREMIMEETTMEEERAKMAATQKVKIENRS
jgi:hypothetical protein